MKMMKGLTALAAVCVGLSVANVHAASSTVVGFDGGGNDGFTGNAFYEATGGNPGGNAHFFLTAFGISQRTGGLGEPVNANFLGDYSSFSNFSWGLDVKVDEISDFFGNPIPRELGIAVVDRDITGPDGPSGLYFPLGIISSANNPDYTTLTVTVEDPTQTKLPPGVIGFGDTNDVFEPVLPLGATFATVLAGVDEFQVTTFVPGFFFTNANYDVRFDNIFVNVPEPGCGFLAAMIALGFLARFRR